MPADLAELEHGQAVEGGGEVGELGGGDLVRGEKRLAPVVASADPGGLAFDDRGMLIVGFGDGPPQGLIGNPSTGAAPAFLPSSGQPATGLPSTANGFVAGPV